MSTVAKSVNSMRSSRNANASVAWAWSWSEAPGKCSEVETAITTPADLPQAASTPTELSPFSLRVTVAD
jgi:hypothetical protein